MAAASRAPTGSSQVLQHRPAVGAQTTTQTSTQAVLHLRGAVRTSEQEASDGEGEGSASKRRIQWAEDVIDNEGMGKKKSKGLSMPSRTTAHFEVCHGWALAAKERS